MALLALDTHRGYAGSMKHGIKNQLARRLKIIEGQIRGLQKMVEAEKYCVDIITQSAAIQKALASVDRALLENHLATHVAHQMKSGQHAKAIKEMVKVYELSQRSK